MKTITIKNLKMRNFKGFKEFELDANNTDLNIYGETGSGKTTVFDAFWYVLFGKNSQNKQDFPWKPLDKENNPIHHLETEVEVILTVDGEELKLARITKENWTKKRGFAAENFTGHTTTYRVNDLKKSKSDFNKQVAEIIDEESFKQLTNIYFVPESMDKKERRKMLFELSGDLTDQTVIASNKDLAPLTKVLEGRSIEDRKALVLEERTLINKELKETAVRIDETDRFTSELVASLGDVDQEELNQTKVDLQKQVAALEQEISSFANGNFVTNKRSELQTAQAKLETERSVYLVESNAKIDDLQQQKHAAYDAAMEAQAEFVHEQEKIKQTEKAVLSKEEEIKRLETSQKELREQFFRIREESFPAFDEHKTTCQVCGQGYPEEKQAEIKEIYEKEATAFNLDKAAKLEEINSSGRSLTEKKAVLEAELSDLKTVLEVKTEFEKVQAKRDEAKKAHESIKEQIQAIQSLVIPFEQTTKYKELKTVIEGIQAEIKKATESSESELQTKRDQLSEVKVEIDRINDQLYQFVLAEKQEERKNELIEEEKKKSTRYGELENQLYLLDEFIRTKVSLLTEKINSHFQIVEWKLFDTAINGGLEEVCEPTVDGRPFSGGLSNGERINAGADIVNTLSRLKQVSVPIFIDNAEGVTNWKVMVEPQLIQLIATKGQKELKIESQEMAGIA